MKRIALKIDVNTYRGTLLGVPALIELLQKHDAGATFFFSLGHDRSGCEARATSLARHYDLTTRLYGRLLPGPNIGVRCAETLRQASSAGFEVGIHAWNRVGWERNVHRASNPWVESEMVKACTKFEALFGAVPKVHAAAGWRMNRHALRLTQRLGFSYASDCRGSHPFIPVIDGEIVACPQLPTTLPTLDELLVLEPKYSPEQAVRPHRPACQRSGRRPRFHPARRTGGHEVHRGIRTTARHMEGRQPPAGAVARYPRNARSGRVAAARRESGKYAGKEWWTADAKRQPLFVAAKESGLRSLLEAATSCRHAGLRSRISSF
ncbi:MAG: polysaccharide deacetylase family protein [Propionivibrio sp.]